MIKLLKRLPVIILTGLILAGGVSCKSDPKDPVPPVPPVPPTELEVKAKTTEGAGIKITDIDYTKITWEVAPGTDCLSYRVEIFPYVRLQNDHFEMKKTQPNLTEEECIKLKMFDQTGAGAGTFEGELEFDTDMMIFQGFLLPDFEYMVAVYGCLNDDGTSPSELTTIKIKTKAHEALIGNPKVNQRFLANYRQTQIFYEPNEDCKFYCNMDIPKKDADEIIEEFGEDFLRELILTFAIAPASEDSNYLLDWGAGASSDNIIVSLATAMDQNMTRAPKLGILEYAVEEKPGDTKPAIYDIVFKRTSSYVVQFDVNMDPDFTKYVFYALAGPGTGTPSGITEHDLDASGWGVTKNDPYQWQFTQPNSEYTLLATGRNHYFELTPMKVWPLGKSKPIGSEITGAAKDEMMQVKVNSTAKTSVSIEYVAETEVVASWFRLAVTDGYRNTGEDGIPTGPVLTDPANRTELIAYMRQYADIDGNSTSEDIRFHTWTGMEPGTDYVQYILAENWDGNWALYETPMATEMNIGGANPSVAITSTVEADKFTAIFTPNTDTNRLLFMITDDDLTGEGLSDSEMHNMWMEQCVSDGLNNYGNTASITINYNMLDKLKVCLAVPYGADNKRGKLAVMKFNPLTGSTEIWNPTKAAQINQRLK